MTPKEKAKSLIDDFINLNFEHAINTKEQYGMSDEYHKKCAIICVNEIIEKLKQSDKEIEEFLKGRFGEKYYLIENQHLIIIKFKKDDIIRYWVKVKQELELL